MDVDDVCFRNSFPFFRYANQPEHTSCGSQTHKSNDNEINMMKIHEIEEDALRNSQGDRSHPKTSINESDHSACICKKTKCHIALDLSSHCELLHKVCPRHPHAGADCQRDK